MGNKENLTHEVAIEKIKSLTEDAGMCMFNTQLTQIPFKTRPMAVQQVEADGSIWFFSGANSTKNKEIADDRRVHLMFMNNSASEYLSLYGNAEIIVDLEKAKELWTVPIKRWFEDGPEDTELTLIKFTPDRGYYWDTQNNKSAALLKIAYSVISGHKMDLGIEGKINL